MLVYVEPELSVLIMIMGTIPVKPLTVETEVMVEPGPDMVVVFSIVSGYSIVRVDPCRVVVTVVVVTDSLPTVVVACAPPIAEEPPTVTVLVACARLLPSFSAFLMAESGIGVPAIWHAN